MSMLQDFDVDMMSMERLKERRAQLMRTKEIARKVCFRGQYVNLLPFVPFFHWPYSNGVYFHAVVVLEIVLM